MKPAVLYVVTLLFLLRLQPQPVANGCCDAFRAALCRGTDLPVAIISTSTVTTTTTTTTNSTTTTTTIEMPQWLIPNGSNDTPVCPAAAAAAAAAGTPSVTKVFPSSLPANESRLPAPDPDARGPTPPATEKSSPLPFPS